MLLVASASGCGGDEPSDVATRDAGADRDGAATTDAASPPDAALSSDGGDTTDAGPPVCDGLHTVPAAPVLDPGGDVHPLVHTFRHHRPHWGARAQHGESACSYYGSAVYPDWRYSSSWGTSCHATRRYFIESTVTRNAGWAAAVVEAFKNWDIPTVCTPHWTRTTDSTMADVRVRAAASSPCAGPGTSWYACASDTSGWAITLNTAISMGVGVSGRLDVESLVTVELAHVVHFAHSPNWPDSVSMANTGRWASTSSSVPSANSCDFVAYRVCTRGGGCGHEDCPPVAAGGCGNFRTLRPGDFALAEHIAGRNPTPPHPYDDGTVHTPGAHVDLAMLYAADSTAATLFSWTSGAGAFALGDPTERWSVTGLPTDGIGDRVVAGDFDGDSRDDVAALVTLCDGSARVLVWAGSGAGLVYEGDTGAFSGALDLPSISARFVAGDFDADGRDDLALFEALPGNAARIHVLRSTDVGGEVAFVDAGAWWEVARGYDLAQVGDRFVAGDFDADGRDDVATAYQYPDGTFRYHVWTSTGTALTYSSATGWYQSGAFTLANVAGRLAAADFDGDGRDDVAMLRASATGAAIYAWRSTGTSFALDATRWSVASGYTPALAGDRFAAGDFDADGRADLVAAYQYPDGTFHFHVWTSTGSSFAYAGPAGWYTSGMFDLGRVSGRLVAGNWNAD